LASCGCGRPALRISKSRRAKRRALRYTFDALGGTLANDLALAPRLQKCLDVAPTELRSGQTQRFAAKQCHGLTDLLATLQELEHLGVGFVSLTEALDLTTPAGRAMAGLLAVFAEFEREILRERVRAGLAHARQNGQRLGRPLTAALHADQVRKLYRAGIAKAEISRRLNIGRTSVRRILAR